MGKYNRSEIVTVLGTPCAMPLRSSNSNRNRASWSRQIFTHDDSHFLMAAAFCMSLKHIVGCEEPATTKGMFYFQNMV
jgi:hypothetical protein